MILFPWEDNVMPIFEQGITWRVFSWRYCTIIALCLLGGDFDICDWNRLLGVCFTMLRHRIIEVSSGLRTRCSWTRDASPCAMGRGMAYDAMACYGRGKHTTSKKHFVHPNEITNRATRLNKRKWTKTVNVVRMHGATKRKVYFVTSFRKNNGQGRAAWTVRAWEGATPAPLGPGGLGPPPGWA